MKCLKIMIAIAMVSVLGVGTARATVRYVDGTHGDDANDGLTAENAFKTIQAAIEASRVSGDRVVVADGRYAPVNTYGRRITVESVNGAAATAIDASLAWASGITNRCATLVNNTYTTYSVLRGFTLVNGRALQGGAHGGGAFGGLLDGCVITNNCAVTGGGAAFSDSTNCVFTGNRALSISACGSGGAAYDGNHWCASIENNTASVGGGIAYGHCRNCRISGNESHYGSGALGSVLLGCLVVSNLSWTGAAVYEGAAVNCTIVGNRMGGAWSGGDMGWMAAGCASLYRLVNSIVAGNVCDDPSITCEDVGCMTTYTKYDYEFSNCCVGNCWPGSVGTNIVWDAPMFADAANGDFRLDPRSPCIDAGAAVDGLMAADLAGVRRCQGAAIDIGAYECGDEIAVTFDPNGGACDAGVRVLTIGGRWGTLPECSAAGREFDGWYTEPVGGSRVTAQSVVERGADTLHAHWAESTSGMILRMEGNGAEMGTMPDHDWMSGVDFPKNCYVRAGHEFLGWSQSKDAESAEWADGECPDPMSFDPDERIKRVYAVWRKLPATETTEVPVPHEWLLGHYPDALEGISDEAARKRALENLASGPSGKSGAGGAPIKVWEEYVMGTDPARDDSALTMSIVMEDGRPAVKWSPALNGVNASGIPVRSGVRKYVLLGKKSLSDADWAEVPSGGEARYRFFRVEVSAL